jgi:hypothetical protein
LPDGQLLKKAASIPLALTVGESFQPKSRSWVPIY